MNAVMKFLEKLLTSILVSFILAILSFSFFTGKFPPQKSDMSKAYQLMTSLLKSAPEAKALGEQVQQVQAQGGTPSLDQLAEFQRLSLRRTEISIELLALFPQIQLRGADPMLAAKLQKVSDQMTEIEKEMTEVAAVIKNGMEPPAAH